MSYDGPGIPHLEDVLLGRYRSETGLGQGIVGAKRLVLHFDLETSPGKGTTVVLGQPLPSGAPRLTEETCREITGALVVSVHEDPFVELQRQNRELLATLDESRRRQAELDRLNAELEDTNRGVMALYAELDDKAESLKRASEAKTRFLANMTHEFRTPLNSILSLANLLLDQVDGELLSEQARQVSYIRKSAEDLSTLVNDLLDLAKIEAGKVDVRPAPFEVAELFGGLKGVLRPLLSSNSVVLRFDDPRDVPTLHTDEGKVSIILRNFISNALKYTEKGEVRVRATHDVDANTVSFSVSDTGIGIAAEDLSRIFEEFEQVAGTHQKRVKGTGLGLPLSRRLAELLGGTVTVESVVGVGSTFAAVIPVRYDELLLDQPLDYTPIASFAPEPVDSASASPARILVVDDDEISRYVLGERLGKAGYALEMAEDGAEGLRKARASSFDAVFLDLTMPIMSGEEMLTALADDERTRSLPVIVYTSETLDDVRRARLLGQDVAILTKETTSNEAATIALDDALERAGIRRPESFEESNRV